MRIYPIFIVAAFGFILAIAIMGMPQYGLWSGRAIAEYYIEYGAEATGSSNIVNGIIWDFRGFDTMGEETVLFVAAIGVYFILRGKDYGYYRKKRK